MIYPPRLKKGDWVAIVSPSGIIAQSYINNAVFLLEEQGFKVAVGKNTTGSYHFFSGTTDERLSDINNAIEDDKVKAIFCARGGYGAIHLVDGINWQKLMQNPKWLIGFSDITVLHSKLNSLGIASIHGPMPKTFPLAENNDGGSFNHLIQLLSIEDSSLKVKTHQLNCKGSATGQLIGGNLSIIYSLLSMPFCFNPKDKILFIEDLCEQYYHLDRMMNSLKFSNFLSQLKAVIVGQFSDMKDSSPSYGLNAYQIIDQYLKPLAIPVAYDFPLGHTNINFPLLIGAEASLDVAEKTTLTYTNGKTQQTWKGR